MHTNSKTKYPTLIQAIAKGNQKSLREKCATGPTIGIGETFLNWYFNISKEKSVPNIAKLKISDHLRVRVSIIHKE